MPTYKLTIEYEGTRYSGWQTQTNTAKTVQGHLLRVASEIFGQVDLGGAGRTDAGVHAMGQVAHLRTRTQMPLEVIPRKFNDLLPHDIHVLSAVKAADSFHARHDASMRTYLYQISHRRSAFSKPFIWWIKDRLDEEAMTGAAATLPGMHDFSALSDRRAANESKMVSVELVEIGSADDLLLIRLGASHFLWKMVRKIIAALVEVGRGTLTVANFESLVNNQSEPFSMTAPPSGLFLEAVTYPGESFDRPLVPVVPVFTWTHTREKEAARKWDAKKRR